MNGYSQDLRRKIVSAVGRAMPKARAARLFGMSLSSVRRYAGKAERGESLAPKRSPGSAPKLDDKARKLLEEGLKRRPFATLQEAPRVRAGHNGALGEPLDGVPRHREDGFHQEKGGRVATERDEFLRAVWRVRVAWAVEPGRLVFVDECRLHTLLARV